MTGTFSTVVSYTHTVTVRNSAAVLKNNLVSFMYPRRILRNFEGTSIFKTIQDLELNHKCVLSGTDINSYPHWPCPFKINDKTCRKKRNNHSPGGNHVVYC